MDILQLLKYSKTSDFSIRNLPFGIILEKWPLHRSKQVKDYVIDVRSFIHIMALKNLPTYRRKYSSINTSMIL